MCVEEGGEFVRAGKAGELDFGGAVADKYKNQTGSSALLVRGLCGEYLLVQSRPPFGSHRWVIKGCCCLCDLAWPEYPSRHPHLID